MRKLIEGDPDGWYCYTTIHFVGDTVLLGHCAGDSKLGTYLGTLRIRRICRGWHAAAHFGICAAGGF